MSIILFIHGLNSLASFYKSSSNSQTAYTIVLLFINVLELLAPTNVLFSTSVTLSSYCTFPICPLLCSFVCSPSCPPCILIVVCFHTLIVMLYANTILWDKMMHCFNLLAYIFLPLLPSFVCCTHSNLKLQCMLLLYPTMKFYKG
jgi:hypothetical protein